MSPSRIGNGDRGTTNVDRPQIRWTPKRRKGDSCHDVRLGCGRKLRSLSITNDSLPGERLGVWLIPGVE